MRVLMLDKNFLVDRRITLMADALARDGHEIHLIHLQPPPGFVDRSERRRRLPKPAAQLKTIALPPGEEDYLLHPDGIGDRPPHVEETLHPGYRDPRVSRRGMEALRSSLLRRNANKYLAYALAYLRYPALGVKDLLDRPRLGTLRYAAATPFAVLAGPTYLRTALTRRKKAKPSRVRGVRRLDAWEEGAVRYAEDYWAPDVIVANDAITLRAAAEIKMRLGIPLVYDAHELYSYQPSVPHDLAKALFREERKLIKYVDELVVINRQQGQIMERDLGVRRWTACPNATPWPARFDIRCRYDWIRDEKDIPPDHQIILFQGGINRLRRVDYLLKGLAGATRKDVHLAFLTFGTEIPEFQQMARELGVRDRVHFLDIVPWDEMLFWAASASAGVMPYQGTDQNTVISSPNKLYEFIMAGTPVIGSSDLVNVRRIVEQENFGVLVPFRTEHDYAQAIDLMFSRRLGGPDRFRASLIEKAHKYSWDEESKGVVAMYRKLTDRLASRTPAKVGAHS